MKALEVIQKEGMKGFFARWKEGIDKTTPLEQTRVQVTFTKIIIFGILCGFAISVYNWKVAWWLAIILGGAFGNTYVSFIAIKQKLRMLEQFENPIKTKEEEKNV